MTCASPFETFRYDLASLSEPRVVLITDMLGKRSTLPRLGHVVLPALNRRIGSQAYRWVSDKR
jgi:hypothetical protein